MGKARWLGSAAAALLVLILLAAWAVPAPAADPLSPAQRAWLQAHGPIKVGAFKDYPPFGFVDGKGWPQGISIDYWRLLSQKLAIPVSFTCTEFAAQLKGLKAGRFDSLAGIFNLPSRTEDFDFTKPFYTIDTYIWAGPAHRKIKGWDGLGNLEVGVVQGDSGQVLAKQHGLAPKAYASYPEVVDALAKDEVQAMILDQPVAAYYLRQRNLEGMVRHTGAPVESGRMCLPVAKGNAMLLGILDRGVAAVSPKEMQAILAKWLGPR